jgi:hypothetical protein
VLLAAAALLPGCRHHRCAAANSCRNVLLTLPLRFAPPLRCCRSAGATAALPPPCYLSKGVLLTSLVGLGRPLNHN